MSEECKVREKTRFGVVFRRYRPLLKFLGIFLGIYLLAMSAILLADVYYADDVGRAETGYTGWARFSRYVSEILSHFVHADEYLTDVSPLPQILAVVVSAVSSTILLYVFVGRKLFTMEWQKYIWLVAAVVPLVLCPYFLECLSYKYDSVYMALSVLAAVLPVAFRGRKRWVYGVVLVLCTLFICTSYQTSLGILPMAILLFEFRDWFRGRAGLKEVGKNLGFAAGMVVGALVIFKVFLMREVEDYISNSFPPIGELVPDFIGHFTTYVGMVFSDFKVLWLVLFGVILGLFLVVAVWKTKRNRWASLGLGMVCLGLMMLCCFGFYSLFSKPLYAPRASYGVGALIALAGLFVVYYGEKLVFKVVVAGLGWCFFVFAFTYGNALAVQDKYVEDKIGDVVNSLSELELGEGVKVVQLDGDIGQASGIRNMPQNFQMLNHLLESSYSNRVVWNTYRLIYRCDFCDFVRDEGQDLEEMGLPLLESTAEYDIYGDEGHVFVRFLGE